MSWRLGCNILNALPFLFEMHRAISQQFRESSWLTVFSLVSVHVLENAESRTLGKIFAVSGLLHARKRQQTPDHLIRRLELLALRTRLRLSGQNIEKFLSGKADKGFSSPVFLQSIEQKHLLFPVVRAAEPIAGVFEQTEPPPRHELTNVFHDGAWLNLEIPMIIAGLRIFETHLQSKRDQRIFKDPVVIASIPPDLDKNVVPGKVSEDSLNPSRTTPKLPMAE